MSDSPAIAHDATEAPHEEHPSYLRHHFENTEQQADTTSAISEILFKL